MHIFANCGTTWLSPPADLALRHSAAFRPYYDRVVDLVQLYNQVTKKDKHDRCRALLGELNRFKADMNALWRDNFRMGLTREPRELLGDAIRWLEWKAGVVC